MKKDLLNKINSLDATVCIIGLGYVGLPLLMRFSKIGFNVIGIDIDEKKVEMLQSSKSYIDYIEDSKIKDLIQTDKTKITSNFIEVKNADAIIMCVPTPLKENNEPELKYVRDTIDSTLPYVKKGQVVCLESTTYPGTTREEIVDKLVNKNFKIGNDFFVVYSPEREDPGNMNFDTQTIPKLCGGFTDECLQIGSALYSKAIDNIVEVNSLEVAEMAKLLENIHRAVNIGLVNEMKIVADKMDIDIFEVIEAASTKPFGFTPYYPGPGLGGHCIPIDPFYLSWKAGKYGVDTKFIKIAGEVNKSMPSFVVKKTLDSLKKNNIEPSKSRILVLGLAYKKNVDDMRESPSLEIIKILDDMGAEVAYSDPHIPTFPYMRSYDYKMDSVDLNRKNLLEFDAAIIVTDHDRFDYELILENSKIVIDSRGVYRGNLNKKIVNA